MVHELRDGVSGVKRCECKLKAYREKALGQVPPRFGEPRLDTLMARCDLHPKQAKVVEAIRDSPEASYFLYGKNGVGKTHLSWALYCYAVEQGRRVVACKLDELLDEYRRYTLDPERAERPRVLAEDLQQRDRRWLVLIDEMEKASPTEFAAKRLFALVDAVQEFDHQLVCTSNLKPADLQARWSKEDEVWGNSIARRIAQTCTTVDLF